MLVGVKYVSHTIMAVVNAHISRAVASNVSYPRGQWRRHLVLPLFHDARGPPLARRVPRHATNFACRRRHDRADESRVAARLGAVALWRSCFPHAVSCTLRQGTGIENPHVTDVDLALLRGVRYLDVSRQCVNVTDAGIAQVVVGHNTSYIH